MLRGKLWESPNVFKTFDDSQNVFLNVCKLERSKFLIKKLFSSAFWSCDAEYLIISSEYILRQRKTFQTSFQKLRQLSCFQWAVQNINKNYWSHHQNIPKTIFCTSVQVMHLGLWEQINGLLTLRTSISCLHCLRDSHKLIN